MLHRNDRDIEQKLKALNPAMWAALYPRAYGRREPADFSDAAAMMAPFCGGGASSIAFAAVLPNPRPQPQPHFRWPSNLFM